MKKGRGWLKRSPTTRNGLISNYHQLLSSFGDRSSSISRILNYSTLRYMHWWISALLNNRIRFCMVASNKVGQAPAICCKSDSVPYSRWNAVVRLFRRLSSVFIVRSFRSLSVTACRSHAKNVFVVGTETACQSKPF